MLYPLSLSTPDYTRLLLVSVIPATNTLFAVRHVFRIFIVNVDATCFMVVHAVAETEEFLCQLLVRVGFGKMRL